MAALIEVNGGHDEHGLVWPTVVAPYRAVIVAAKKSLRADAEALHERLCAASEGSSGGGGSLRDELVLDDRWGERLGHKLAEAELIGFPFVVVLGRAWEVSEGRTVELQERSAGRSVPKREVGVEELCSLVAGRALSSTG